MKELTGNFPRSELIKGVEFEKYRIHKGDGDMWPLTWAADGHIYAGAGDNMGSPMNLWRIQGSPAFFASTYKDTYCIQVHLQDNMPVDPVQYCTNPEIRPGFEFKPSGLLCVNGTLYFCLSTGTYGESGHWYRQRYLNSWIITSTDFGKTWNREATPQRFFTGRLAGSSFLQFGKDYEGARDAYVYNYFPVTIANASCWENCDFLLLGRVGKERILDRSAWEFYAGKDAGGNPQWEKDDNLAKPVFEYALMTGQNHVCYNKGIGRYLMGNYGFTDQNGVPRPYHINDMPGFAGESRYPSQLTLFEASEPWGPWRLFYQDDNWGTYGDYQPNFPTKWMSEDGKSLYMVSSGAFDDYNFTVQKLTLVI